MRTAVGFAVDVFLPFTVGVRELKIPRTPHRRITPLFGSLRFGSWPAHTLAIVAHTHLPPILRRLCAGYSRRTISAVIINGHFSRMSGICAARRPEGRPSLTVRFALRWLRRLCYCRSVPSPRPGQAQRLVVQPGCRSQPLPGAADPLGAVSVTGDLADTVQPQQHIVFARDLSACRKVISIPHDPCCAASTARHVRPQTL
jgi:hypothetical protein